MKNRTPRTLYLCACLGLLTFFAAGARASAAVPGVSVRDASAGEGDGRNDGMIFVVTLSEPSAQPVTVGFNTQAVTATPGFNYTAGTDYNQVSSQVTFPAGATWGLLNIGIVPDSAAEQDETFRVVLTGATNAVIADGEGVGTIIDDDGAVFTKVQLAGTAFNVSEVAGHIDFQVTRTGDLSAPSVVFYYAGSLGASERADFTQAVGPLRFAPNESSKTFTLSVANDAFKEADEGLYVMLYSASGCTLGAPSFATVAIQSEDAADGPSPVSASAFDAAFFVRQHYLDFFGREPDAAGLQFWTNQATNCGDPDPLVCRINVSAAFFLSTEFQETGFLAYKTYKAAYGNLPGAPFPIPYYDFLYNAHQLGRDVIVNQGDWEAQLEQNKRDYFDDFVRGLTFPLIYPTSLTPTQFVGALFQNAGVTPTADEMQEAVGEFGAAADTSAASARARALRRVAENPALTQQEKNRAFVLMEYFGYMRRDPDQQGYFFWLGKLDEHGGNYITAEMVKAFITSGEYIQRFGQ